MENNSFELFVWQDGEWFTTGRRFATRLLADAAGQALAQIRNGELCSLEYTVETSPEEANEWPAMGRAV